MKKIFLLIILFVLCLSGYSQLLQKTYRWNETVTLDNSSNDTIYLWGELDKDFTIGALWSITVKYTTLTTSDVQLGFVWGNIDGGETSAIINDSITLVLNNVSRHDYRGRPTKADNIYSDQPIVFDRAAFMIITTSAVSGVIELEFVQRIYYNKL